MVWVFLSRMGSARVGLILCCMMCTTGAATEQQQAARYYEDAQTRFELNDIESAKIQLKNALQLEPTLLAARVLLVQIHLAQGNGEAAEKEVRLANKLGADRALTVGLLAQAFALQYKYLDIVESIHPEQFSKPIQIELLNIRGHAFVELGKYAQAREAFQQLAKMSPASPRSTTGLGLIELREGKLDQALELAQRALRIAQDDPDSWSLIASVQHANGDLLNAIDSYNRVLATDPDHLDARIARAGIWIDLGQNQQAADDMSALREAVQMEPRASYLHSIVLARMGAHVEARKALEETANMVGRIPKQVFERRDELMMLAGITYYSLGRFEKARPFLSDYVRRHPEWVGARKLLGGLLVKNEEYERALQVLEPALGLAPNDYKLLSLLSTVYMHQGKHEKASQLLERAVQYSDGAAELRTDLALSRMAQGEHLPALQVLEKVFSQDAAQTRAGVLLGMLHIKRGEYKQAVQVAKQLNESSPENLTVLNLLGSASVLAGERDAARDAFQAAVAIDPEFLAAQIGLGRLDVLDGNFAQAKRRFTSLLEQDAASARLLIELARMEQAQGDLPGAIRWLQRARDQHRDELAARLYLVELLLQSGQGPLALQVCQEAELIAPDDLKVLDASVRSHIAVQKIDIARVILKNMNRLAGYDPAWLYRIAELQMQVNNPGDAVYSLQKSIQGNSTFLPAQVKLVEALLALGNIAKAQLQAQQIVQSFPEQAVGHQLLGDIAQQKGRLKDALKYYKKALATQPNAIHVIKIYGVYDQLGENDKAQRLLQKWLDEHPRDFVVVEALAEVFVKTNQLDQAARRYEQLLVEFPQQHRWHNNLAYLYFKTGNPKALAFAQQAWEISPEDPQVNDTLGLILLDQGKAEEALRFFRDAHFRQSADADIRYHMALALHALGRVQQAVKELEYALANGQVFDGVEAARALLQKLQENQRP